MLLLMYKKEIKIIWRHSGKTSRTLTDRGPRFVNQYVTWRGLPSCFAHFIYLRRDLVEGWGCTASLDTLEMKRNIPCPGGNGISTVQHVRG